MAPSGFLRTKRRKRSARGRRGERSRRPGMRRSASEAAEACIKRLPWRSRIPDSRVNDGVGEVYEQVQPQHEKDKDHRKALNNRKVTALGGVDNALPYSRKPEYVLEYHRPAYQRSHLEPGERDRRNERIPHRVPAHDHRPGETLALRRANVILAQNVQHGRTNDAGDVGTEAPRQN